MNSTLPKPHFAVLDGLRGTAALTIVVFHFLEMVYPDYSKNPLGHGFLAVDFFFVLSGFVIGYAYDDRSGQISYVTFFRNRLIRLHPLVVLGSVLGLIAFLFDPFGGNPQSAGWWQIAFTFLCSLLLIPSPGLPDRQGALIPLNSPAWSLFMEYVANIFYAFVLWRLGRRLLAMLGLIVAGGLLYTAHRAGTLIGGWADVNIMDGFARIFYCFTAGLLVFRYQLIISTRLGFGLLSLLLLATFMMPYFSWNWLAESLVVMFVYPLIVSLGAGAAVSGWWSRLCDFTGRISYPLYMTHIMVIWSFGHYYTKYQPSGWKLVGIIAVMMVLLTGFAWLVMKYYDEPLRAYLGRKKKTKVTQDRAAAATV